MKRFLVFGVLFLSLTCSVLIYLFLNRGEPESEIMGEYTDLEVEKLVSFPNTEVSTFIFTIQEDEHNHKLYINMTPFLSIEIGEKKIEKFRIENFDGYCRLGKVVLIHPTDLEVNTSGRNFLFQKSELGIQSDDIVAMGNSIEYTVVEEVNKYNEVRNSELITPYFGIVVREVGSVDYKAVKERDGGFEPSKYLEYSGISPNRLDTDISFDIFMEFEGGRQYRKKVTGKFSGESFKNEVVPLFNLRTN